MTIPDASLGSIIAATVAGAISLTSLIVSKENKTSEFRQLWIDSLRSELSAFISHSIEIRRHREWGRENSDKGWETISESYKTINESITRIRLRLNPTEKLSKKVLNLLKEYEKAFAGKGVPKDDEFNKLNHEFVEASQQLLKAEWKRVRNGEVVFQIVRATSFAMLISGLVVLFHQHSFP